MNLQIWKYSELPQHLQSFTGKRTVLVGGCFDIIHYGHIVFLEKARAEGEILIIALESDQFIRTRKKRTPIHTQEERAYILSALKMVDAVILLPYFETDTEYNKLVEIVSPDVVAVTEGDTTVDKKKQQVEKTGGTIKIVSPLLSTFSTSQILEYEHIRSSGSATGRNTSHSEADR